jgi:serpin B
LEHFGYSEFGFRNEFADRGRAQVAELPYVGNELSMLVFLPETPGQLPLMEAQLTAERIAEVTKHIRKEKVNVYLPRFKMDWGAKSLVKPLDSLGMKTIFNPAEANLSGLHSSREHLFVSEVMHKAFVDVNEEGTEAAAATAVVVGRASAAAPAPPKVFRADRPFVFAIRENATGAVLFLGRFTGPVA